MKLPPVPRPVFQRDRWLRLVIELQAVGIVLILENRGELVGVALELDGNSHLATWIPPSHILFASTDPTCRRRGTNLVEKFLRLPLETETPKPTLVVLFVEHPVPLLSKTKEAFQNILPEN